MNKIIITLAVVSMFSFATPTFASTITGCGNPALNHPEQVVFDGVSTTTIPGVNLSSCETSNPENVVSAWGKNSDVPNMKLGQNATDEGGFSYTCPQTRCVDITHTSYYRAMMTKVGSQLKSLNVGYQFPMFTYWIR